MISLAAAWALLGLAALPVLAWLHRRRREAEPVVVPSLLFLEDEPAAPQAPERFRVDAELLLTLAAATCLVLAAAGPRVSFGGPEIVVRVVMHHGPWEDAKPQGGVPLRKRADDAWASIRDAVEGVGALETVHARGDASALLAAARAGTASLRVVVTDRLLDPAPLDVRVVAVGDTRARNLGIVAVDLAPDGGRLRAFATVWNDSGAAESVTVVLSTPEGDAEPRSARVLGEAALSIPPFSARSAVFDPVAPAADLRLDLRLDRRDDVVEDDGVILSRLPVRVGFATGPAAYPQAHRHAVLDGLRLVVGADLLVPDDAKPDLFVGPPDEAPASARLTLALRPTPPGAPRFRPPPGSAFDVGDASIGRDLDPTGCDLVYAPDPALSPPYPIVRTLPAKQGSAYEFVPDPLAGTPPPVDHPMWPIFLENLVAARFGRPGPAGYRVVSLVDPPGLESTRIGRDVRPFDAAWLAGLEPAGTPRTRELRPWLAGAGLLLLGVLWLGRRRGAPRRVP